MKKLAGFLALLMSLSCFSACDISSLLGGIGGGGEQLQSSVEEPVGEQSLQVLGEQEAITLKTNESKTYAVNKNIAGKEYIKLTVNTNVNLVGKFQYHDVNDNAKIVTEDFFVEAAAADENGNVEFKQFFDAFRKTGHGLFDKQLLSVSITNVGAEDGNVQIKDATVINREIDDYERELYVEKNNIKVGADLATGGTFTFLQRTNYNGQTVDEVIKDGDMVIGVDAKSTLDEANGDQFLSSEVNLINIYDAGRQFQQSYYANVGGTMAETNGENGYTRALCTTADSNGYYWPYNPVQGGDCNSNPSQIIDYEVSKDQIYVKVRAMDWAKGNDGRGLEGTVMGGVTTKSYMENWYTIKGGLVYVRNRFIDWNGFEDLEKVPVHSNELPAAYVVHPLHNYVCYTGNDTTWTGELTTEPSLGPWNKKAHPNIDPVEEWFAWVNDDGFGVGVYVPNTDMFASGRTHESVKAKNIYNNNAARSPLANEYRYNKPERTSDYTSCYVTNTSYTAPVVTWTMQSYVPMEYTYIISVDYVGVMRQQFKDVCESGTVTNETLSSWK